MRYWLTSVALALFVVGIGATQETKQKTKDPDKGPKTPAFKEPKDVFGKSFEQWRNDIKSGDPSKREIAMKNITQFGPAKAQLALPDIISELSKHKKGAGVDLSVRVNGTMAMSTIFGGLATLKKEPSPKQLKDAIAIYRMFLRDKQVMMRMPALQGLKFLPHETAREAIDDVIELVEDRETWEVRKEAVLVLQWLAPNEKKAVYSKAIPALRGALADASNQVRYQAVVALASLGNENVLADLRKLKTDPSVAVRVTAYQGIVMVAKAKALPDLEKAMKDDPTVQVRVAVVQLFPVAAGELSIVDVRKALSDPSKEVRLAALNVLPQYGEFLGKNAKEMSITIKMLNNRFNVETDSIVSMWAHATIMTLTAMTKEHMNPILKRLDTKDANIRMQAHQIVRLGGKKAKPLAYDTLLKLSKDADPAIAVPAIETLVVLHAYEVKPMLESLKDSPKVHQAIRETASDAIDSLTVLYEQEKNRKTNPKTPLKK